ncbi:hypothetical protein GBA52_008397 [Prunus armeniaca]|nr:hypothetical protein GBA52_008397 [Prunus armeniaca]
MSVLPMRTRSSALSMNACLRNKNQARPPSPSVKRKNMVSFSHMTTQSSSSITPLVSFSGDVVQPIGSIHLPISIGSAPQRATFTTPFLIVNCPTAYNITLGRPALVQVKDFISTHMLLLKFPTPHGMGTVRGDQLGARSCYASAVKYTNRQHRGEALAVTKAPALPRAGTERPEDPREESITQQAKLVEELELVTLHDDIPRSVYYASIKGHQHGYPPPLKLKPQLYPQTLTVMPDYLSPPLVYKARLEPDQPQPLTLCNSSASPYMPLTQSLLMAHPSHPRALPSYFL